MINAEQLKQLHIGAEWVDALNATFERFDIMNPLRKAAFIGQCGHECGNFRILEENLNYRAEALQKLWPKRFDAAKAQMCARNPKLIANTVYSNRMGNSIQLTGHANYFHAGQALGVDFVMQPELVATPMYAALTAGWFWDTHKLNQYADSKDYKTLTKKINGGFIGLEDRIKHIDHALLVLAS